MAESDKTIKQVIVKKALLIGINYIGTENELNGCINDSINLKKFIIQNKYVNESDIIMMNDTLSPTNILFPTRQNILNQLTNLITFASKNLDKTVELFLSYSGHGTGITDRNSDEVDGQDEALVPVDFNKSGFILDDVLRSNFINKLSTNVKLVFLCDACHSGTIFDLKYQYLSSAPNQETIFPKIAETSCEVVTISGCRDDQTSADAYLSNTYQGAMTASFINNYKDEISYKDLITKMRSWLVNNRDRFTQVPQLCTGKKINLNNPFLLSIYNN